MPLASKASSRGRSGGLSHRLGGRFGSGVGCWFRSWLRGRLGGRLRKLRFGVAKVFAGTLARPAATKPLLAAMNTVIIREVIRCAVDGFVAANILRWAIIPSGERHFAAFVVHLVPRAGWLWSVAVVGGWGVKVVLAADLEGNVFSITALRVVSELVVADPVIKIPRPRSALRRLRGRFGSPTGRDRTRSRLGGRTRGRLGGLGSRVAMVATGTIAGLARCEMVLAAFDTVAIGEVVRRAVDGFVAAHFLRWAIIPRGERHFAAFVVHLVPRAGCLESVAVVGGGGAKVVLAAFLEGHVFPIIAIRVISQLVVADAVIEIPRAVLLAGRGRVRGLGGCRCLEAHVEAQAARRGASPGVVAGRRTGSKLGVTALLGRSVQGAGRSVPVGAGLAVGGDVPLAASLAGRGRVGGRVGLGLNHYRRLGRGIGRRLGRPVTPPRGLASDERCGRGKVSTSEAEKQSQVP